MLVLALAVASAAVTLLWFLHKSYRIISSERLTGATVTSHMHTPIRNGHSLIYCCTFQLAWYELKKLVGATELKLKDQPAMVSYLNEGIPKDNLLSEDSYLAMAGHNKDHIVQRIKQALKEKFGPDAPELDVGLENQDDILAYAFLFKKLDFTQPFEVLDDA